MHKILICEAVEKDLGMRTGEIGTLVNYFSEGLTLESTYPFL